MHYEVAVAVSVDSQIALPARSRAGGAISFVVLAIAACSFGAACGDGATSGAMNAGSSSGASAGQAAPSGAAGVAGGAAGSAAGAAGSGKLSFANDVYRKVVLSKCGNCHNDAPSFGGLAMFPGGPETAYKNLVGVPSGKEEGYLCRGSELNRVEPGNPEKSLMYLKLTAPPCGGKMPPAAFGTTTQEQVDLVRQWILDGAAP
jgi:mono/diheme cytochrome c family protein